MAGLAGDWGMTVGTIYEDGKPVTDSYAYLTSTWATPQLSFEDGENIDCWKYKDDTPGWDSEWPQSALDILSRSE